MIKPKQFFNVNYYGEICFATFFIKETLPLLMILRIVKGAVSKIKFRI